MFGIVVAFSSREADGQHKCQYKIHSLSIFCSNML